MSSRARRDPIEPHSAALCEAMNANQAVILSYARYFGSEEATNCRLVEVDQDGFLLQYTLDPAEGNQELRVAFSHSVQTVSQVKHELLTLAKEAEKALRGSNPSKQGAMPDSHFYWPEIDFVVFVLGTIVLSALYLDFFPNTTSPALQWFLHSAGPDRIHQIVQIITVLHAGEALVSLYFTLVVGSRFFSATHVLAWFLSVLVFGYPSLFQLVPLANRQRAIAEASKDK